MFRNIIKFSMALAFALLFAQSAYATTIGVFHFAQIMQNSAVAKSADADLQARFGAETQALDAEFATLQKNIADFQKQAAALSETARREKAQELEIQSRTFEEKRTVLSQKLTPTQQSMERAIREILQQACSNYASANKFDLIIDGGVAAFVGTNADITNELIAEMDKIWKERGSKFE